MTMDFEAARAAICGRLNTGYGAAYSSEPIEYENRKKVDRSAQVTPFLGIEIHYADGEMVGIGADVPRRYHGAAYLVVYTKAGAGAAIGTVRLSYLDTLFAAKQFGGVNTLAPKPLPMPDLDGWHRHCLRIPFYFDTTP